MERMGGPKKKTARSERMERMREGEKKKRAQREWRECALLLLTPEKKKEANSVLSTDFPVTSSCIHG